jgi:hypothetical protein
LEQAGFDEVHDASFPGELDHEQMFLFMQKFFKQKAEKVIAAHKRQGTGGSRLVPKLNCDIVRAPERWASGDQCRRMQAPVIRQHLIANVHAPQRH